MGPATDPAGRHRSVAAQFAAVARSVPDWEAPTPVPQWQARDVVGHLLDWFPGFLASGAPDLGLPELSPAPDPAAAWEARAGAVQALLEDDRTLARTFRHPRLPEQPLAAAIDQFYTSDVFMHTWDLARSAGTPVELDPRTCTELLVGMQQAEEVIRTSGQYGPAHPVPPDAPVQDRLMAFIGRDPGWRPPQ